MKTREREIQRQRPIYSPLRRDSIFLKPPKRLPGSLSTSRARKEEQSRVSAGDTGEETSSSPGRAPPPTRSNAARLLGPPGASRTLGPPGPLAPPRARPARTWGPAARGGAERTVQGQQAGQQRAEPSHVAARGRGPEGARAPSPGLPARLERAPDCRARASRPPPAPPPPARPLPAPRPRHRLDRWFRASEAAGGRAERPTRQRPRCQLPRAGRSARAVTLRDAAGAGQGGGGAGRAWGRGGARWRGGAGRGSDGGRRAAGAERGAGECSGPAGSEVPRGAGRRGSPQSDGP